MIGTYFILVAKLMKSFLGNDPTINLLLKYERQSNVFTLFQMPNSYGLIIPSFNFESRKR